MGGEPAWNNVIGQILWQKLYLSSCINLLGDVRKRIAVEYIICFY